MEFLVKFYVVYSVVFLSFVNFLLVIISLRWFEGDTGVDASDIRILYSKSSEALAGVSSASERSLLVKQHPTK